MSRQSTKPGDTKPGDRRNRPKALLLRRVDGSVCHRVLCHQVLCHEISQ